MPSATARLPFRSAAWEMTQFGYQRPATRLTFGVAWPHFAAAAGQSGHAGSLPEAAFLCFTSAVRGDSRLLPRDGKFEFNRALIIAHGREGAKF